MDFKRNIIITGGAGFIGSHVVRLFVNQYPDYHIINLDKLTYAGNLANLKDIEDRPNYTFVKADICDFDKMSELIRQYRVDGIIHLAAESHVDRSIKDPFTFARTNVMGTLSLLQAAKEYWESLPEGRRSSHRLPPNGTARKSISSPISHMMKTSALPFCSMYTRAICGFENLFLYYISVQAHLFHLLKKGRV